MTPQLSEAYVLGLVSDIEATVPQLKEELRIAQGRAATIEAELTHLLGRIDTSRETLTKARNQQGRATVEINEGNMEIASLHQQVATLQRRADDIKLEMERVSDEPAIRRKLRRERAKLSVAIEDHHKEIEQLRSRVEQRRQLLNGAEETLAHERDRQTVLVGELDKMQNQLPSPYLYTKLFENLAAQAHCNLYLDRVPSQWRHSLREAIDLMLELHEALRAGKYRLDKNSELVGGRSTATAEAIYGAVALGEMGLASQLFNSATDPGLFFHQIFNVFRVWCLGLYLADRHRELRDLLRLHQFSEGLRGGYVNAFVGLVTSDRRRFAVGLKDLTRHEWELWQDPNLVRGAGVVNLGALALGRLAADRGLAVELPGPTVPAVLLTARPNVRLSPGLS